MKTIPKYLYVALALMLAVGGFFMFRPSGVYAIEPGLYPIEGNPDCGDLNSMTDEAFAGITSDFGFKIGGIPQEGITYLFTSAYGELTGNAPEDSTNYVTFPNVDNPYFNWAASLGIDAVIVKGGPSANAYVYIPEAYEGGPLTTPDAQDISHVEFCYDYELTATKTANAEYTRTYTWKITKSVDPSSHAGWAGDAFTSDYDVFVDRTVTDSAYKVTGQIIINNPTPFEVGFSVEDYVDSTMADVTCPSYTLSAGASVTCSYVAELGDDLPDDGTNTATITSANPNVFGAEATDDYAFGAPTDIQGYDTINVTDYFDGDTIGEALGSASGHFTFEYDRPFQCPTDMSLYEDGVYTDSFPNYAEIDETGQQDDANVDLTCYIWDVSKTANGTYNDRYEWEITKEVDPESQSGFPGDTLEWTWSITWNSFFVEEINHAVSGVITVDNPSDMELTVAVTDYLTGGFAADVTCNDADGGTSLTVAADSSGTCDYTAEPSSKLAQNTATATRNSVSVSDTVNVNWVKGADVGLDAEISDTNHVSIPVGSTQPFEYDGSHTCSTDAGDYGEDGSYSGSASNTATITWTGGSDSSTASTEYDCEAGFMDLLKLTDGVVNSAKNWQFALFVGPDGFGGTQVGSTSSTSGDADGILEFGSPALRPDTTYTVCELGVPAGWTSLWQVDVDGDGTFDATVIPYNPNEDDDPPEDVGNRCVDFGAGTTIPVTVGTTIHFQVDNTYPGGAPRTPGYWKNWNRCTGGGQQYTADTNGGWEEGYWLLEDVLDPDTGGGIAWDDILSDDFVFPITDCNDAVLILDKRNYDGKKVASDPLHNLATHLLAAQLNFGAGACTTQDVLDAALAAETLLDEYNFDGYGHDKLDKKDPNLSLVNTLASYLDSYNNGLFCGDGGD